MYTLLLSLCIFSLSLEFLHRKRRRSWGPCGLPIVGSLFALGPNWASTFLAWKAQYGDVFTVQLGDRTVVVINSAVAAKELFIDQGSVFISRPPQSHDIRMLSPQGTAGLTIGTSPWDDSCKRRRKAVATALNKAFVGSYTPIIEYEVLVTLADLLEKGEGGCTALDPSAYFLRLALNTSLGVAYGTRTTGVDDGLFGELCGVFQEISNLRSMSGFYDYVPILRILSRWRKARTMSVAARRSKVMEELLNELLTRIEMGTDRECIVGKILRDTETMLDRQEIMSICNSVVAAGVDTAGTTLLWVFGLLAQRPDVQTAAYKAMLAVGNTPDASEQVPYMVGLVKEASRFFTVTRLSLPRSTVAEATWGGHVIPAGTTATLNAWACNRDESVFGEDVNLFRPERYLELPGEQHFLDVGGMTTYAFGVGRQICPGIHLANREMYVMVSFLLFYFEVRTEEKEPFDIDPLGGVLSANALVMAPKTYKVRFVPRAEQLDRLKGVLGKKKD